MEIDRRTDRLLRSGDAGDVIDVRVREQDVPNHERVPFGERDQPVDFVARIDQDGFARLLAADNEAILEERADGLALNYHVAMILAVLDDLMFTSKIKTTAGQLGVAVSFVRSADAALAEMRKAPPSLVILDLNNPRTSPLAIVQSMKADPALASVPTLGYVSHVDTATIDAARQAGVGEILARSAFTMQLADILGR